MEEERSFLQLCEKIWTDFAGPIQEALSEDDLEFWELAVSSIIAESMLLLDKSIKRRQPILAQVGACSHWLRPHQTRQTIAGGFAHPYGYGDGNYGYSRSGLPQFDWSLTWKLDSERSSWNLVSGRPGRRPLVLRIALPTRTLRHPQAAVQTQWAPGSPVNPREKSDNLYYFRKQNHGWERVGEHFAANFRT